MLLVGRATPAYRLTMRSLAPREPAPVASDNGEAALDAYARRLARAPLAPRTRALYAHAVRAFLAWTSSRPGGLGGLSDPTTRRYLVSDYRRHLFAERRMKPATVNLALAGVEDYCRRMGLGPSGVARDRVRTGAPRALDEDQLRALLRAAERRGPRARALVALLGLCGLRLGEVAALDAADVALSARRGHVVVRQGKGAKYREVPLSAPARDALSAWLAGREAGPVFPGPTGALSARSLDRALRRLGEAAGVELSAHDLRHTFATRLVRAGVDVVTVAELAGHARLETTRRYALPSAADRERAVEAAALET